MDIAVLCGQLKPHSWEADFFFSWLSEVSGRLPAWAKTSLPAPSPVNVCFQKKELTVAICVDINPRVYVFRPGPCYGRANTAQRSGLPAIFVRPGRSWFCAWGDEGSSVLSCSQFKATQKTAQWIHGTILLSLKLHYTLSAKYPMAAWKLEEY